MRDRSEGGGLFCVRLAFSGKKSFRKSLTKRNDNDIMMISIQMQIRKETAIVPEFSEHVKEVAL